MSPDVDPHRDDRPADGAGEGRLVQRLLGVGQLGLAPCRWRPGPRDLLGRVRGRRRPTGAAARCRRCPAPLPEPVPVLPASRRSEPLRRADERAEPESPGSAPEPWPTSPADDSAEGLRRARSRPWRRSPGPSTPAARRSRPSASAASQLAGFVVVVVTSWWWSLVPVGLLGLGQVGRLLAAGRSTGLGLVLGQRVLVLGDRGVCVAGRRTRPCGGGVVVVVVVGVDDADGVLDVDGRTDWLLVLDQLGLVGVEGRLRRGDRLAQRGRVEGPQRLSGGDRLPGRRRDRGDLTGHLEGGRGVADRLDVADDGQASCPMSARVTVAMR